MSQGASAINDPVLGAGGRQGRELQQLIRSGRSFSGRERNCFFLNTGQSVGGTPRFANLSAGSGLDLSDDARAVGVSDWDHDGDLDLWIANRSGPQLRYLQNTLPAESRKYLSLKLEGTRSNRDAIGARATLVLRDAPFLITRSVKAGSGYLSQSSKRLHFGLNASDDIEELRVTWPDGSVQSFQGLQENRCYLIQEGNSSVNDWTPTNAGVVAGDPEPQARGTDGSQHHDYQNGGTLLSVPLPLPDDLHYLNWERDEEVKVRLAKGDSQWTLVNLWAPWCLPCLKELQELADHREALRAAGIEVLALCVDEKNASNEAPPVETDSSKIRFGWTTHPLLDQFQLFHDDVFDLHSNLPLPCSFLIDQESNLVAFYRGPVTASQLVEHVGRLSATDELRRDASVPFAGRWSGTLRPRRLLATALSLLEVSGLDVAIHYVQRHQASINKDPEFDVLLFNLGQQFSVRADYDRAEKMYLAAIQRNPQLAPAYFNLGVLLAQKKSYLKAIENFQQLLKLTPQDRVARFYLGVTLARVGRVDQAADELSAIDSWGNLKPGQQFEAAIVFALNGDVDRSRERYEFVVKQSPLPYEDERYQRQLLAAFEVALEDAQEQGQQSRASAIRKDLKSWFDSSKP